MTRKKREQYEALIESIMIGEIEATRNNPELDNILRSKVSVEKKRMAITSVLDENVKVFNKIRRFVENNNVSRSEFVRYLVEQLKYYVKDGEIEQKKYGEVMTPFSLVNDMLDTLPKEVWNNPDLKWFDPANGVGIFPVIIVERLMKGLEEIIPDEDERYRHIMEEMIYVSELQPRNAFLFLVGFDPLNEFDLNIYLGSSLEEGLDNHIKNEWEIDKFDVIVMNPPYQEQKTGFKKTQPLWDRFVEMSINNLTEGGYLVAVHPDGWRIIDGVFKSVQDILINNEIIYLEIHDEKDGKKTFGATTTYDFYCVRKRKNNNFLTKVKFMDGKTTSLNLSEMEFIPNGMVDLYNKVIATRIEDRVNFLYSRTLYGTDKSNMNVTKIDEYKYPCIYTIPKNGKSNFWFSNVNNKGHFNQSKVIWSNGAASNTIIDIDGQYGLTQFSYGIIDNPNNLENIKKAMDSPMFIKLLSFADGKAHRYNRKVIALFKKDFWKEFITENAAN